MPRLPRVVPAVGSLALLLSACGAGAGAGPSSAQIAPPVAGQAAEVIEGGGPTEQDYDLVPGQDGRVFLVLDCAAVDGAPAMTARRVDGKSWGAGDPDPDLSVPCDADGQRLAVLTTGTPDEPVPLVVRTAGDRWRVAQTHQRP